MRSAMRNRSAARTGQGSSARSRAPSVAARAVVRGKPASPLVVSYPTAEGTLYIGIDGPLRKDRPGNGGLRVSRYENSEEAVDECRRLASTMTAKHDVYNTGFSGAKLVLHADGCPQAVDKPTLMAQVAEILHDLEGSVYTGCDVNTSQSDMEHLTELCPYVLASVGCPTDASIATGHGVFAAVQGVAAFMGGLTNKTCFVKGCGKVGSTVAQLLVAAGAKVLTFDVDAGRADIPGATNLSGTCDWKDVACDFFVPCSVSRFIDEPLAARLDCKAVVGSCNAPFATPEAMRILEARGIVFVHEAITSAGAVLADSIERFNTDQYRAARPSLVYAYIRTLVQSKTTLMMELRAHLTRTQQPPGLPVPCSSLLEEVKTDPTTTPPVGELFAPWVASQTEETDVVIVGGGMAGTAAAYWLSKEAPHLKGVVLEQASVAHPGGSSYGKSRMYREMYSDPYFAKMQRVALDMWRGLEAEAGVQLLKRNGLLFYGEADTGETVEGSIAGAKAVMEAAGLPHEHLQDADQLTARFPTLAALPGQEGLYEASAGSINSSAACAAMMKLAAATGRWTLREHTRVDDVFIPEGEEQGVVVVTGAGKVVRAKHLVIAAGPWTNEVLRPLGYQLDLEVWRVHWAHARVEAEQAPNMPQWFHFRRPGVQGPEDGGLFYGFPPEAGDGALVKVGVDFTPDAHKSRSMQGFDYAPDAVVTGHMDMFMRQNLKGFEKLEEVFVSPYTMSKDNYFILDALPAPASHVSVFSGGSGRAFKFAPLIGRCLADLVLGRTPVYDIAPLSLQRAAAGLTHLPPNQDRQGGYPDVAGGTHVDGEAEVVVAHSLKPAVSSMPPTTALHNLLLDGPGQQQERINGVALATRPPSPQAAA